MKALSVVSPSGRKIASGEKTIEVRRWLPDLSPHEDLLIVENDKYLTKTGDIDPDGRAVAIVRISLVPRLSWLICNQLALAILN